MLGTILYIYTYIFVTTFRFFNNPSKKTVRNIGYTQVALFFAVLLLQFITLSWPNAYKISKYF